VTLEVEVELVEDEEVSDPNILDEGLNLRLNWGWSGPPLPGAAAPAAPGMKWEPQIMQRVILSRKEGLRNKFTLLNVPPHALAAMKKLAIGGEERRIDGKKGGGILRQEEGDLIPSLRRVPGQGQGLDDIHAAYLRFDARAVDEGKPLYVPEEIPPPSLEQGGPLPSP
jgi:hypothetical protein